MLFSDLEVAGRLEGAEGSACREFAVARRRLFPESGSEWMERAGVTAVFDGVGAPTTQTFGLGLSGAVTGELLDEIEEFFLNRGADVHHEVSPLAGVATLNPLCRRGYRPIEVSSVMYRAIESPAATAANGIFVRVAGAEDALLWSEISARGWTYEHPEMKDFMLSAGMICAARENCPCFVAELDGVPGAAGALCLHEGVALFGGAATVPEMRRRGLQSALLVERMRYAAELGYDLAMMVAEVGGESQRNAERTGFRVAYTRMKWELTA